MAEFNEIQEPRYQTAVRRLLSLKGYPNLPSLSPELQACLVLESERPEWRYLHSYGRGFIYATGRTAVAAQRGKVQVSNPANSGNLLIIEHIHGGCGVNFANTSIEARVIPGAGSLLAAGTPRSWDTRWPNLSQMNCTEETSAGAVGGGLRVGTLTFATAIMVGSMEGTFPLVIEPNNRLLIQTLADNLEFDVAIRYFERPLVASEE